MSLLASSSLPWCDRAGRLSPLRAMVFAALWLPVLLLTLRTLGDDLGARPLVEAIHVSGDWAARLLVATIAVTPLRLLSGQSKLIGIRRMIGLSVAVWAFLHVALWVVDKGGDAGVVATELLVRPYLTLGFVAVVGLGLLAATSTDGAIRRLGGAAWKRLHGLVHAITILTLVHVFLQSKLDLAQGAILTGIACGGLAVRIAADRGASGRLVLGAAAVTAFTTAAASEALMFALKSGRSVLPLLATHLDFEARVAPGWIAAGVTLVVGSAALIERVRRERGEAARGGRARGGL